MGAPNVFPRTLAEPDRLVPKIHMIILKRNKFYFHVDYSTKNKSFAPKNTKSQNDDTHFEWNWNFMESDESDLCGIVHGKEGFIVLQKI